MMPGPILLLAGFSAFLLRELDGLLPAGSVLILEEPDVITRRRVASRAARHPCVAQVIEAPIQHPGFGDGPGVPGLPASIDRVAPGTEYGVTAAAVLAARLGLPGIGTDAAPVFQDKQLLRRRLAGVVPQPRWVPLDSAADAYAFTERVTGGVVIKPSRRQGSLGVTLCAGPGDLPAALGRLRDLGESLRSVHAKPDSFMIEERLRGAEVSVEALVADGEVCFVNVTDTELFAGPHPVEAGHTIPTRQPLEVRDGLAAAMRRLVAATGAHTTILHAEWIVDPSGTPWLVECAARPPGDNICSLISLAYASSFVAAYLELLRGKPPPPMAVRAAAAIRFVAALPGRVTEILGVEDARALPGVLEAEVSATPGRDVGVMGSSYSRLGHVTATAPDRARTVAAAERARELIKVLTG